MTSLGETLRGERVKRNLTLDRVSSELKISSRLLEAIETERFDRLPGGVFTKSFVRQYAHFLGLDEDEITGELQRMLDPQPSAPVHGETARGEVEIPLPRMKEWEAVGDAPSRWTASLPAFAVVVVVIVGCSLVYSWWQRHRTAPVPVSPPAAAQKAPAVQPPAPTASQHTAEAPAGSPATGADTATAKPPIPEPPAPSSSSPTAAAETGKTAAAAAPVPATPAPGAPTPGTPVPNAAPQTTPPAATDTASTPGAVHVQVTAAEPAWISIRSDGKSSFSGTLAANETRTIDANSTVVVRLGNAGGVTILLNGKPIGPVGPKGQVRTVQLNSGGFQIVSPEPPKPAPRSEPVDPF